MGEMNTLKNFILELNPFYNEEMLEHLPYDELVLIAKEVAEEL